MSLPRTVSPIVRAIDVGYGNVKFVNARSATVTECSIFPALSPKAAGGDLAGELLARRNTWLVHVGGQAYEVGPDVALAQGASQSGRMLHEDYCLSEQYRALVFGALHAMAVRELDLLVLGLPVNTHGTHKIRLAEAYTGTHEIAPGRKVLVRRVLVLAQPLGGFFDYAVSNGLLASMSRERNLVLDPGYETLDGLATEGTYTLDARSGAIPHGGMGEVLRAVAEQMAADAGCQPKALGSLTRIDAALRDGTPLKVFGKPLARPMSEYVKIAQDRARDPLMQLLQIVGDTGDIDNVVLVGGGTHIYGPLLASALSRNVVSTVKDPVFANARGFQIAGELWLKKQKG
jgi:plasmid segregation protein ParM